MTNKVTLHGYRFSVYHRIARVILAEKGVVCAIVDVNPFADVPGEYLGLHPFGRVPALSHGGFSLYETSAIGRYIDTAFSGPSLTPTDARAAGRMAQVIAIIDNYGYWPMVRQVFSHRVFQPLMGETASEAEIELGLAASAKALRALEVIAAEGLVLNAAGPTLADCHLGPMIDYFTAAEEGAQMLGAHPALSAWWERFRVRGSMAATDPGRPYSG